MKKIKLILIIILAINFSAISQEQKNELDNFAKKLFKSLKHKNFENSKELLIESSDINFLPKSVVKRKIKKLHSTDSLRESYYSFVEKRFTNNYNEGLKIGINWKETEYLSCEYNTSLDENILSISRAYIYFKFKNKKYSLQFSNSIKINDKWKHFKIGYKISFIERLNNINDPEEIGKQVFNILKDIRNVSKKDYYDNFISFTEINQLSKNNNLISDEKFRSNLASVTEENIHHKLETHYNATKLKGIKYRIDWNTIEYLDFIYEIEEKNALKKCSGKLFFKSGDNVYKIYSQSFYNGNEYLLVSLRNLIDE